MSIRQLDGAGGATGAFQTKLELLRSFMAGLVFILIEDDIDQTARRVAELIQLDGSKLHENLLNWRGEFDAEAFSLDEVNQRLRKRFRSTRKPASAKVPTSN